MIKDTLVERHSAPAFEGTFRFAPRVRFRLPVSERKILLFAGDVSCLAGAYLLATGGRWLPQSSAGRAATASVLLILPLWTVLAGALGMYEVRVAARVVDAGRALLLTQVVIAVCLASGNLILPGYYPRAFVLEFLLTSSLAILGWRLAYLRIFTLPRFGRRVIILGDRQSTELILATIRNTLPRLFRIAGVLSIDPSSPHFRPPSEFVQIVSALNVQEVVVCDRLGIDNDTANALVECQKRAVKVRFMSGLYEELTGQVPVAHIAPRWVMELAAQRSTGPLHSVKRGFDVLAATLGLLGLALVFLVVACAIKMDSPGPILFRQDRAGFLGRVFKIVKFRTMRVDAESDGAMWAEINDARMTRVGRVLRRIHLDELPQVINVFRGEMSIVGPRPERPEFVDRLALHLPYYRTRFLVKPGITGWAQVLQGYSSSIADSKVKLQYDLYYVKWQSISLDLMILFKTAGAVVRLKGR